MIPKFRLFDKRFRLMLEIHVIDFYERTIDCYVDDLGVNRQEVYSYEMNEDNYVLMQSTGLADKNGREIFEGDVVKYWENIGYIEFYQGSWVINWNDGSLFDLYDNENNLEIIGNIHEHSGLLKENGE